MTAGASAMVCVAVHDGDEQLARDATRLALAAVNVTLVSCAFSAVRFLVMHVKHCRLLEGPVNTRTVALLALDDDEMVELGVAARAPAKMDVASPATTAPPSGAPPAVPAAPAVATDTLELSFSSSCDSML
jgi:hypothetical protein